MSRSLRPLLFLATVPLLVGALGCPKKPPAPAAEVQPTPAPAATPVPVTAPSDFQPKAPEMTAEELPADIDAINRKGYLKHVYFDFDQSDIRPDQRDTLDANAAWLKKYPTVKIRIEGHCDERGTREYNLALGERRANAAKEFLVSLGIDGSRMETVSYGKERPLALGHDEAAWAQNRRAHFLVIAR